MGLRRVKPPWFPDLAYESPNRFSVRQRLALALVAPAIAGCIKAILSTVRFETRNRERLEHVFDEHGHVIVAVWHETIPSAVYFHRNTGYHTLVSYSYDGELAAHVLRRFRIPALRGSSSRGGSDALKSLVAASHVVPLVGFTADGPRGPRREAKPGASIVSARTGYPVLPVALVPLKAWRLNSWDRFAIPKPFSRVVVGYAPPIPAPASTGEPDIEEHRVAVERTLNELHESLEDELGAPAT